MIKSTLKNLARPAYHFSKRVGYKLLGNLLRKKEKQRLVFVFGGRNDGWPTIGRDLYSKNQYFKESGIARNTILYLENIRF